MYQHSTSQKESGKAAQPDVKLAWFRSWLGASRVSSHAEEL